jgi:hypothetical protein
LQLSAAQRAETLVTLMQERMRLWTTQGNVALISNAATHAQFNALFEEIRDLAAVWRRLEPSIADPAAETLRITGFYRPAHLGPAHHLSRWVDALMAMVGGAIAIAFAMTALSLPILKLSARQIPLGQHMAITLTAFTGGMLCLVGLAGIFALAPGAPNAPTADPPTVTTLICLVFIGWSISHELSRRGVTRVFPIGLRVIGWLFALSFIALLAFALLNPGEVSFHIPGAP